MILFVLILSTSILYNHAKKKVPLPDVDHSTRAFQREEPRVAGNHRTRVLIFDSFRSDEEDRWGRRPHVGGIVSLLYLPRPPPSQPPSSKILVSYQTRFLGPFPADWDRLGIKRFQVRCRALMIQQSYFTGIPPFVKDRTG